MPTRDLVGPRIEMASRQYYSARPRLSEVSLTPAAIVQGAFQGTAYLGLLPPLPYAPIIQTTPSEIEVFGNVRGPEAAASGAHHLPRRRQGADVFAGPRLDSADHHGEDGGVLPPRHLVASHGG